MRRKTSAPSFIDALLPPDLGQDDMLVRIDSVVDWPRVAQLPNGVYDSPEGRPAYAPLAMKDRGKRRGHKHQAGLPRWQRKRTGLIAKVRAPVEQAIGTLKRCYGYWQVRCMGLRRNETEALFKALAYNLRRAGGLREARMALA